jgi:hypothetical protein
MYLLNWFDRDGYYSASAADAKSAWSIYWALKKLAETTNTGKMILTIHDGSSYCNPEKGILMHYFEDDAPNSIILSKG